PQQGAKAAVDLDQPAVRRTPFDADRRRVEQLAIGVAGGVLRRWIGFSFSHDARRSMAGPARVYKGRPFIPGFQAFMAGFLHRLQGPLISPVSGLMVILTRLPLLSGTLALKFAPSGPNSAKSGYPLASSRLRASVVRRAAGLSPIPCGMCSFNWAWWGMAMGAGEGDPSAWGGVPMDCPSTGPA